MAVNLVQAAFRFRNDFNPSDTGTPSWPLAENANGYQPAVNASFRIRFRIDNTGTTNSGNHPFQLYAQREDGVTFALTTTSADIVSADPSNGASADNSALTVANFRLTAGPGTKQNGQYDITGATANLNLAAAFTTELEFGVRFLPPSHGHTYTFKVYYNGVAVASYTNTPSISIPAIALSPSNLTTQSFVYEMSPFPWEPGGEPLGVEPAGWSYILHPAIYDFTAADLTPSPVVLAASPLHQISFFAAPNLTDAAPVFGRAVLGSGAEPITTASPIFSSVFLNQHQTYSPVSLTTSPPALSVPMLGARILNTSGIVLGTPVIAAPLFNVQRHLLPVALTTFSPAIAAAQVVAHLQAQNLAAGNPIIPPLLMTTIILPWDTIAGHPVFDIAIMQARREPLAFLRNRLLLEEDGSEVMQAIFSNYNDDIEVDADGTTLLGRTSPYRGPMQRIPVTTPLFIDQDGLKIDLGPIINPLLYRIELLEYIVGELKRPPPGVSGSTALDPLGCNPPGYMR